MKYLTVLFILFPMLVFAAEPATSPTPAATGYTTKNCDNKCSKAQVCTLTDDGKYNCTTKPSGYKTKDCDNKCAKDQQCTLSDDERYYCTNLKVTSDKTPKPLEVYLSCQTVGGVFKGKCSPNELAVYAIQGTNQILIREHKPGQCCIAKSKLKVY